MNDNDASENYDDDYFTNYDDNYEQYTNGHSKLRRNKSSVRSVER